MEEKNQIIELIPDRLYFASAPRFRLRNTPDTVYVTANEPEHPEKQPYFGPPSISDINKYCTAIDYLILSSNKKIVHWSSYLDSKKFTRAVFLLWTFLLFRYEQSAEEVIRNAKSFGQGRLLPIRHTTTNMSNDPILDMKYFYAALEKLSRINQFYIKPFDVEAYEDMTSNAAGYMNLIAPGKFLVPSYPVMINRKEYSYLSYLNRNNFMAMFELNVNSYDEDDTWQWQRISAPQPQFWQRWTREYLSLLQEESKCQSKHLYVTPGQLVLIKADDLPPCKWKVGRITATVPGPEGYIRVVQIRSTRRRVRRAVQNVARLSNKVS